MQGTPLIDFLNKTHGKGPAPQIHLWNTNEIQ